jgi:hypothetical protein
VRGNVDSDNAATAGAIVYDDLLSKPRGEILRHDPADAVHGPARCVGYDEPDRTRRVRSVGCRATGHVRRANCR